MDTIEPLNESELLALDTDWQLQRFRGEQVLGDDDETD